MLYMNRPYTCSSWLYTLCSMNITSLIPLLQIHVQYCSIHVLHVDGDCDQLRSNNLPGLLEGGTLGAVLEFMERYQTKLAQIDSRKLEVEGQQNKLSEEVKVMQAKVNAINPEKKGKKTEDVQ